MSSVDVLEVLYSDGTILIPKISNKNDDSEIINSFKLEQNYPNPFNPTTKIEYSIDSDNGTEFAKHEYIAKKLNAKFYFAHTYSSWERGLSGYSNKLIRQYVPKKSNFEDFSIDYLNEVNIKLNNRPRKILNYDTLLIVFMGNFKSVALGD